MVLTNKRYVFFFSLFLCMIYPCVETHVLQDPTAKSCWGHPRLSGLRVRLLTKYEEELGNLGTVLSAKELGSPRRRVVFALAKPSICSVAYPRRCLVDGLSKSSAAPL